MGNKSRGNFICDHYVFNSQINKFSYVNKKNFQEGIFKLKENKICTTDDSCMHNHECKLINESNTEKQCRYKLSKITYDIY